MEKAFQSCLMKCRIDSSLCHSLSRLIDVVAGSVNHVLEERF